MNFYPLLLLCIANLIPNIFFKGRTFEKISWGTTVLMSLLFFVSSAVLVFQGKSAFIVSNSFYSLFLGISGVWFCWPFIIRKFGTYPHHYLSQEPFGFFARFDKQISVVKYFEILLQQASFLYLYFIVLSPLTTQEKLLAGTVIIAIMHGANYFVMPRKWATFYFLLSLPMAPLFGIFILSGHVFLSGTIHILFYIVHNSWYWFPKQKGGTRSCLL